MPTFLFSWRARGLLLFFFFFPPIKLGLCAYQCFTCLVKVWWESFWFIYKCISSPHHTKSYSCFCVAARQLQCKGGNSFFSFFLFLRTAYQQKCWSELLRHFTSFTKLYTFMQISRSTNLKIRAAPKIWGWKLWVCWPFFVFLNHWSCKTRRHGPGREHLYFKQ